MNEQMLFGIEAMPIPTEEQKKKRNKKRNWENAFQKWSDEHGMQENCVESWGACGYGSMCDWCEDNSYGNQQNSKFKSDRITEITWNKATIRRRTERMVKNETNRCRCA